MRLVFVALLAVSCGIRDRIKVTCGETVITCWSFKRYENLSRYTCLKAGGGHVDLPLSVGDSCTVGEI